MEKIWIKVKMIMTLAGMIVIEPLMGQMVPVYYKPSNPQQSTLSNGGGYKLAKSRLTLGEVYYENNTNVTPY